MNKIIASMIVIGLLLTTFIASVDVSKSAPVAPFANIYVDDDNTQGPWDGTIEHPYRTIIDGINSASEGDIVFVFNGIYNESIDVTKSVKLLGEDKYNTIIDSLWSSVEVNEINGFEIRNFMLRHIQPMYLYDCSHCVISGNVILEASSGMYASICLTNCSNCTVSDNNIQVHSHSIGVILSFSKNNEIKDNYLYGSNEVSKGIDIYWDSTDSIVANNTISNFTVGIDVFSNRTCITDNNLINNTYSGISLFTSSNSTISGNKITNSFFYGIDVSNSDNVLISDNIVANNSVYGINSNYGKNVSVFHNTVDNNPCGIEFNYLENSFCANNTITNSSENGINIMAYASNNLISYNNVNNCSFGIVLNQSSKNTYKNNIVNYNEFGVFLYGVQCFNVITKNEIRNNGIGVELYGFSQGKTYAPFENWVVGNNISENTICGIYATIFTKSNYVYYNNFIDNDQNAFDKGNNIWYKLKIVGKSMGNYWDDYTGSDHNGDGIGDTPYDIPPLPFRNKDRYPCMEPIDIENTASSYSELIQSNSQSRPQINPQSNPSPNQQNDQPGSQPDSSPQSIISQTTNR